MIHRTIILLIMGAWPLASFLGAADFSAASKGEGRSLNSRLPGKTMELVDRNFPSEKTTTGYSYRLTADEVAAIRAESGGRWPGDSLIVLAAERKDTLLGYVVTDDVKGKDQYITYGLALTPDLVVTDLEVLTYREPYGYEVGYKSWREQFLGKTPADRLRHGREIRNISGATISARAVTLGVYKILCTLRILRHQLPR